MNKRILSLMLAGLLTMNLAGCSSSSNGQSKDDNPSAAATETIAASETATTAMDYTGTIFDTSYVHEINVEISEEDWAELLENATEKTKYNVNVTIDGNDLSEISFATKGNSTEAAGYRRRSGVLCGCGSGTALLCGSQFCT